MTLSCLNQKSVLRRFQLNRQAQYLAYMECLSCGVPTIALNGSRRPFATLALA